jgi:ElaB/YqjD/DUF883 family membrane-anchored ribosome-binding protein
MAANPVNRLDPHWPQTPEAFAPPAESEDTSWRETAKSWEQHLEHFMGDHPKLTLAAAATVGLLLGWMVKRK